MATTTNGIYYPNDYDSVADIPADMKKIAESVDTKISENKTEINNIKTEQTTQNTNISNLQKDNTTNKQDITNIKAKDTEQDKYIAELEAENARLREDLNGLPKGQASGESIDLNDSAEMRCELKISGNSVQDGEPTPDEPVEVESCGDNINIFDKDNANIKNWYIDTSNKKIASGNSENRILIQEIKPNTTYTISKKLSTFIVATCTNMPTLNSSTTQAQRNDNATKIAIASGSSDKYLVVQFKTQADTLTEQEILNSIKIVEGTETGEYSPYGQGCINEVICNKNLFNLNDYLLNMSLYSDGSIKFGQDNNLYYIPVQYGKKYIMSLNTTLATNCVYGYTNEFPSTSVKSTYNILNISNLNNHIFEPTNPDNKYLCIRINYVSQLPQMANIQLEEGQTATEYVEHKSQTYTIPTQKEMLEEDYFDTKNYKEVHNWKKIVLNGSETYKAGGSSNEVYRYDAQILINSAKVDKNKMVCTHFKSVYQDLNFYEHIRNSTKENPTAIVFYIKGKKTLTEFKAWLRQQYEAETPVTIYYKLTTPEQIEMTLEQKRVSDEIEKAKSYKGVTHMYSTDNVSPVIDVTYKKDIETLFANTLVEGV